ncbi:hypothetical protein NC651_003182 [Populus alba x Populus x berolinensis]|nr:hypothetical protein NC651_003182 [Populus alba x Populus x berolinensis]
MSSRNFVTTDGEGDIPMLIQGAVFMHTFNLQMHSKQCLKDVGSRSPHFSCIKLGVHLYLAELSLSDNPNLKIRRSWENRQQDEVINSELKKRPKEFLVELRQLNLP